MKIELDAVGKGRREHALPLTSAVFESGRATLVVAETEQRPTVLGLIASGRMRPDTGRVAIDGRTDSAALRRRVAVVDAPEISEPEPNVTLAGVAAEELMFAGRRSDPLAVRRWLEQQRLGDAASLPVSNVDPADRVRALCELAVLRKGVGGLVLVSPDRHGGEPAAWWAIAEDFAARGLAVLVIAGQASAPVAEPTAPAAEPDRSTSGNHSRSATARPRLRRLTARTKGGRS
ncbi:hypothetical protein ACI3KY_12485 [Microbacterium sp. ZW T2_14]|uniref:hypothetical protein n=1 Tax=Microbacterium sp. ZW T2_14 TaxID=3378079 RepID=UPI00385255FE